MITHVSFLRAINLGAHRKFGKEAVVLATESAGFTDVRTWLNTGNVGFSTRMRSRQRIEEALEQAYLVDRGFEVPTMVFTASEIRDLAAEGAALTEGRDLARHYVYLLKEELAPSALAALAEAADERGEMVARGRAVHALLRSGYQPGDVDPLRAAKHLGVCTARTYNVVRTVAEKWC